MSNKLKDFVDSQMDLNDLAQILETEGYLCIHEWINEGSYMITPTKYIGKRSVEKRNLMNNNEIHDID